MSPQQLQLLLFKEEAAARIIAFREQRTAPSLSAGSSQLAVQLAQHNNQNPVRAGCPVDSAGLALSDLSILVDQPVAHANSVVTAAGQDGGESKESSSTNSNPRPSSMPSVTQPNPSLEASPYRDAVSSPLYRDVAAVVVTSADLRGVPRLTGSPAQNVHEMLGNFRVIVGLTAERVRPNDEAFGDIIALDHIALLGEGHCLTLRQQLMAGQIDTRAATVSSEPEKLGRLPHLLRGKKLLVLSLTC